MTVTVDPFNGDGFFERGRRPSREIYMKMRLEWGWMMGK